jgi:hypothetical protein
MEVNSAQEPAFLIERRQLSSLSRGEVAVRSAFRLRVLGNPLFSQVREVTREPHKLLIEGLVACPQRFQDSHPARAYSNVFLAIQSQHKIKFSALVVQYLDAAVITNPKTIVKGYLAWIRYAEDRLLRFITSCTGIEKV